MRKRFNFNKGFTAVAFAGGMLISCFCPPRFLIAVLAVWVILLGCSSTKC